MKLFHDLKQYCYVVAIFTCSSCIPAMAYEDGHREASLKADVERYIAIDNVCAWPNLTQLNDGTIIAAVYNQPNHGRSPGDVEIWASADGRFWEKRGVPAPHEGETNRMHAAVGVANNGDLVMLVTGIEEPTSLHARVLLPAWVCRSSDGGWTWTQDKTRTEFTAEKETDKWGAFQPYGDIVRSEDGSLHASLYHDKDRLGMRALGVRPDMRAWHFQSDDDGMTWRKVSLIANNHNETALFPVGGDIMLAASRESQRQVGGPERTTLFRSVDNGQTWNDGDYVSEGHGVPAHLLRLEDGRLLLSYSTRALGKRGILAKLSEDDGVTWSEPIRLAYSLDGLDNGYPSSVQRSDGKVVTAFYSKGVENHHRYHMGVVIWSPNK